MRSRLGIALFLLTLLAESLPAGAQWQPLGLSGRRVNKLAAHGGFLHACTDSGLYRLSFAAIDSAWAPMGFTDENVLDLAALGPDTLLAAKALTGAPSDTISLFRSTDAGASWEPFQRNFGAGGNRQARLLLALAGVPRTLLAAGSRLEKSTDGGLSWRLVAEGFALNALEQAPADTQLLWAGGETVIFAPFVLKSTDAGDTWKQISLFAGGDNAVNAIAGHPTDPNVVYLGMEGRIMKSEDRGVSFWTMTPADPTIYTFGLAIRPFLPLKIYAAGATNAPDPGVVLHQSYDGGLSWRSIGYQAYAGYGVSDLFLRVVGSEEIVYAATWSGVYRYSQIPAGVPESRAPGALAFRCFPNPISHGTEFEFSLPNPQRVSLLVFDTQGRTVAVLADDIRGEGRHRVSWDARGLGAGIYFCRLRTDRHAASLKILRLE